MEAETGIGLQQNFRTKPITDIGGRVSLQRGLRVFVDQVRLRSLIQWVHILRSKRSESILSMSKVARKVVAGKKAPVSTAISTKTLFRTRIKSGCASAAPPLGPLLGKFGLNISTFCKDFNEKTKNYKKGIVLPVTVRINPNRSYDIQFETPSIVFYLCQAAGIQKRKLKEEKKSGEITLKHIYEIAKIKYEDPNSKLQVLDLEDVVKRVVGVSKLIGLEIVKEIDPVKYKAFLDEREAYLKKLQEEEEEKRRLKLQRV